mmetsp:Transcript_85426/g.204718  ORF Transcript_85426/g.204718 Transcript_85426/m.204718 type:complete len:318 (-) Transcript_85426:107-1060(-)
MQVVLDAVGRGLFLNVPFGARGAAVVAVEPLLVGPLRVVAVVSPIFPAGALPLAIRPARHARDSVQVVDVHEVLVSHSLVGIDAADFSRWFLDGGVAQAAHDHLVRKLTVVQAALPCRVGVRRICEVWIGAAVARILVLFARTALRIARLRLRRRRLGRTSVERLYALPRQIWAITVHREPVPWMGKVDLRRILLGDSDIITIGHDPLQQVQRCGNTIVECSVAPEARHGQLARVLEDGIRIPDFHPVVTEGINAVLPRRSLWITSNVLHDNLLMNVAQHTHDVCQIVVGHWVRFLAVRRLRHRTVQVHRLHQVICC